MPCPYIEEKIERHLLTDLTGPDAQRAHDALASAGFRRSHNIIYRPACPDCQACVPVRVLAPDFVPSRTQRRVLAANENVLVKTKQPRATPEQYRLFKRYQTARHCGGEMSRMDFGDFAAMVEETPVETCMFEFRTQDGHLAAACLTDELADGLSAVYSFFDPDLSQQSIGTYVILWLIREALRRDVPYLYLGFWIANSPKMAYKARFKPLEMFGPQGWRRID
ncbi:MAG: arginyltransferase [Alphaproteobacteria bacterium]|nr:arginyltransferase [Alphaproteobacteria bacterium]